MTPSVSETKNLDIEVLRAYAIAITFVAHLGLLNPDWFKWTTYFWLGGGVDLFFCISGFLITTSLIKALNQQDQFLRFAGSFWTRRLFRLWPAAIFWSTITLAISFTFDVSRTFGSQENMVNSWTFGMLNIQNIYIWYTKNSNSVTPLWHYWSLSLEEQFYVILPIILFFVPNRKLLIIPFLAVAIYHSTQIRPWGTLLWFIRSDALLYGTLIALAWHYYPQRISSIFSANKKKTLQLALLICIPLPIITAKIGWTPYYMGLVAITSSLVVLLCSGNLNLTGSHGRLRKIAIYIGSRSYSIYLVHNPIFAIVREICLQSGYTDLTLETDKIFAVLIALVLTGVTAEFSYQFVETPLRNYGSQLSKAKFKRVMLAN
ncbi:MULTISPECIES: acyltransferase family protein [unclassified Pseudomonas]|uniref:acyltransferase family protein n=1 Tax=unclassified Pseudomonas TaxID=196821 RepID=UPI001CC03339|nr:MULTISPECIES: acyltransferase [unclassified Pseudomonas]